MFTPFESLVISIFFTYLLYFVTFPLPSGRNHAVRAVYGTFHKLERARLRFQQNVLITITIKLPSLEIVRTSASFRKMATATAVWRYYRPAQRLYDTQRFLHAAPNNYGIRLPRPRYIPFRHTKNILHALPPETNLA